MSNIIAAAKILEQRTHVVPGKLKITEHFFEVPRDYTQPQSGTLRLFARSARKHETPLTHPSSDDEKKNSQLPWLVYLQGGPGFPCLSPQNYSWPQAMIDKGYQVLCLDQRGTGLGTPIHASTLGLRGDEQVQATYLKSFRADSIVKDCEAIRKALTASYPEEHKKWSIMGQSFGGFCATTYLSFYPSGLREAFLFGGLPPVALTTPDEVYKRQFQRVAKRNEIYYAKYPEDIPRVKRIIALLRRFGDTTVRTSDGGYLPARRFLQLGLSLGFHSGVDDIHDLVLRASNDLDLFGHLTRGTTGAIAAAQPFDDRLLFTLLHEPIYCRGKGNRADWAAERVMREQYPEFGLGEEKVFFTGEMVFPFMLECYGELRKVAKVAELLAQEDDWPELYDLEQLERNEVPVYAAVYLDDMYVDFGLSMETAGRIKGCKTFVTNAMYHDAVRSKMEDVVKGVWALREDVID